MTHANNHYQEFFISDPLLKLLSHYEFPHNLSFPLGGNPSSERNNVERR
jgi:hypothetical protein